MQNVKPYEIDRWLLMEAYKRIKSNGGSYGIDGVSIKEFETNLKDNLRPPIQPYANKEL
jgi:RNA-directed DNA polymerase